MRLVVRPLADADTDSAADYLARAANLDVALRFLSALDRAYDRLCEHPLIGAEIKAFRSRLFGLRFWPVPEFERYLIFYLPSTELVEVVRVLHGSRELGLLLGVHQQDA